MGAQTERRSRILQLVSLVVIGIGVGWLVGLSVSPVVSIVVTSLTATAAALLAVLSGSYLTGAQPDSSSEDSIGRMKRHADAVPIAALVLGIICGSALGLVTRNHGWLGTDLDLEVSKWTRYGLEREDVAKRLFESAYPSSSPQEATVSDWRNPQFGVLFSALGDTCGQLAGLQGDARHEQLELIGKLRIGDLIPKTEDLDTIMEDICAPN